MGRIIGIDIGDTFFRISYLEGDKPKLVEDATGKTFFPSKVSFVSGGTCRVGWEAEMFGVPENTVMHPMTIAGLPFRSLERLNEKYVYKFFQEGGEIFIDAHRVYPTVKDFLVAIFVHAKKLAESHLRVEVSHVVIAIPDGSSDPKRKLIKAAAEEAGLIVKQLFNQAISAVLGYRFDRIAKRSRIGVIDVGASHSTISTLDCGMGAVEVVETLQVNVGVNDMKWRLVQLIADKYRREFGTDILHGDKLFFRNEIVLVVDQDFPDFDSQDSVTISIGCIRPDGGRYITQISRLELEQAVQSEIGRISEAVKSRRSRMYDTVLLIGGGSAMPIIKNMVMQEYRMRPYGSASVPSSEAVALGAAVKAGIIDGIIKSQTTERITNDLGTFYQRDLMDVLIPAGTIFPYSRTKSYGMQRGPYNEKVYQYIGPGGPNAGQDKRESDPNVVILGTKVIPFVGRGRGTGSDMEITFSVDADMVATFIVKDLGNGKEYYITDFEIN